MKLFLLLYPVTAEAMTQRTIMKCVRVLLCIAVATLVYAQPQRPPIKGLSVTSTILEHKPWNKGQDRELTIGLLNNSDKTIVGYTLYLTNLDAEQKPVDRTYGIGFDHLAPEGSSDYILAGQPATVQPTTISNDRVVSVKVEIEAVFYLDGSAEGLGGPISTVRDHRKKTAQQIRERMAVGRHTPAERAALEKQAAFYENAAANTKEVQ